ncbi:hypothetical protein ACFL2H_07940 [Planctomycetota bacterium]
MNTDSRCATVAISNDIWRPSDETNVSGTYFAGAKGDALCSDDP